MAAKKKFRKLSSKSKRRLLSGIRSLSHRAYLARLSGDIHTAMLLERRRDHMFSEAERHKLSGAATRAEESGQALGQRVYKRLGY